MTHGFSSDLCIVRGGGDLASGVVWRLVASGFRVVVLELPHPLTVRRTVSFSTAVLDGRVEVEGLAAVLHNDFASGASAENESAVSVVVMPELPGDHGAFAVVDARMAKRNIDTNMGDAPCVVALGPGFEAGVDCHAVVETNRGHHLGRVLWTGSAEPDTGTPGVVEGRGAERVVRAPADGAAEWNVAIGERVAAGQCMGYVAGQQMSAPFEGVVRGLIAAGTQVWTGLKVADIDPRLDTDCYEISDKALAIGGGVVEALSVSLRRHRA